MALNMQPFDLVRVSLLNEMALPVAADCDEDDHPAGLLVLRAPKYLSTHAGLVRLGDFNNFRNLMLTARTFVRALILVGFVGEDAHERHAVAAPGTIRTHNNNSWWISENRRHK